MSQALDEIPITGSTRLPPDPAVMDVLGYNHELATAAADLVDNSLDAAATKVLIRLVRMGGRLKRIYFTDNGRGIPSDDLDRAMTVAARRTYIEGDLGKFGLGLKGASFSQADSLTLISREAGRAGAGRRWLMEKARTGFECDIVDEGFCEAELSSHLPGDQNSGTLVRLDKLRQAPTGAQVEVHNRFLSKAKADLRRHLGIVFHRFLSDGRLEIQMQILDVDDSEESLPMTLEPLDPFGYSSPGASGYPMNFKGKASVQFPFECHVWTPRSERVTFKMGTTSATKYSGFYYYKADRLLQVGGWNGIASESADLQLARVRIEINSAFEHHLRVSPQKTGVEPDEELTSAIEGARSKTGETFHGFLDTAARIRRDANRGGEGRRRRIEPGRGFGPPLRKQFANTFDFVPGEEPISIRWCQFEDETFVDVDREARTIWLNEDYRIALNGDRAGSLNDTPLLKAMLYLLAEDLFQGSFMGARDKNELIAIQEVLTTAAQMELE